MAAQGGANLIYGAGMLEMGMTFDLAQLLIDAEIYKMVLHTINGFRVTEETLAMDVIKEIGIGGEFVSHDHTRSNFKNIQSHSSLIDRQARDAWVDAGSKGITEKAYQKAIDILENHKPEPLDQDVLAKIQKIVADAEVEYGIEA